MTQCKKAEWEQACAKWPELSPFVLLKLSMTWHGAVLSDQALDRLQEPDYCCTAHSQGAGDGGSGYSASTRHAGGGGTLAGSGNQDPFGIDFQGRPSGKAMPGAILLRDGTNVYINYGETYGDPYQIDWDRETDRFLLKEGEEVLETVDFVPCPDFYGKVTSRGTPMKAVAEARAQKLIMTAFQKCRLWEGGDQCHFCAFFTGGKSLGAVDCEDICETVRAALQEPGRFQEIYVSGGTDFGGDPPFSQEVERYIRVLQAAGRNFDGRFASQLMAPAYPRPVVRRLYEETGLTSYCPNIEVWDRRLFGILCPGKEKWIGHDAWIRRTIDAVEIFGKGNVCTQIVAGAELARPYGFETVDQALKSNLEACEFFARQGVICLSTIWRPHRAARLGFQPMPPLEYYIRLAKEFHEIRRSYGLRTVDDDYRHCGNHPDSDLERMDVMESGNGPGDFQDSASIRVSGECVPGVRRRSGADHKPGPLPETAARMLEDPACRRYLVFSGKKKQRAEEGSPVLACGREKSGGDIQMFQVPSLTSPDGRILALALEEEHSDLGRALVGALWFGDGGPVVLRLEDGTETVELEVSVCRCHLAGPLFTQKYLELQAANPQAVLASVWVLYSVSG